MSADGDWTITINTPMGPQTINANIQTSGDSFTGTTKGPFGEQAISGAVAGDTLTWKANIAQPMPMILEFQAKVDGASMSGTVKLGAFGAAQLSGVRA
jgi:hypothetical protein